MGGSPDELAALEIPAVETVERFERELERLERDAEELDEALMKNAERFEHARRELDALVRSGDVPREVELLAARERRDTTWKELRQVLVATKKNRDAGALADGFERGIGDTDQLSDRLRREAERVAKLAQAEAECEAATLERKRLEAERTVRSERTDALTEEWRGIWSGIAPKSPREMRGWLTRHRELVSEVDKLSELDDECGAISREIEGHRWAIAEELSGAVPAEATLSSAIDLGRAELSSRRARAERRARIEASVAEARTRALRAEREAREAEEALSGWRRDWARAVAEIGLEPDALPEEANAVLDVLGELEQKRAQAKQLVDSIQGMERDGAKLEAHVADLVGEHAPDLVDREWPLAAREIANRHAEAMRQLTLENELDGRIAEAEAAKAECREKLGRVEAELALLLRQAGVDNVDELPRVEERVRTAARLAEDRDRNRTVLAPLLGERTLAQARAEIAEVDLANVEPRLGDIERELEETEDTRDNLRGDLRGVEEWISRLEGSMAAAEAEADLEQCKAKVRSKMERYLALSQAARVLRREIERYRERHQGPVLEHANELYRRITRGHYQGVRPDVDSSDVPTLRAVRSDEVLVDVKGLSDGGRDQLYLALRLATLQHYATQNEPLPLVLDDVLVHFDDERASAALEVLADVAEKMQVLVFTHHAHVVALAREVLGPERLIVHEIARREVNSSDEARVSAHQPT